MSTAPVIRSAATASSSFVRANSLSAPYSSSPAMATVAARALPSANPANGANAKPNTPFYVRTVIRRSERQRTAPKPPMQGKISIDTLGNFIPASCFESAVALRILDHPGKAGKTLDEFALQFSRTLDLVYAPDGMGETLVRIDGRPISLRALFDAKILCGLNPNSDQIGRCPDASLENDWYRGVGVKWLKEQLALSCTSPKYTYANALTKVRQLTQFGGYIIMDLMADPQNAPTVAKLLQKVVNVVNQRYSTSKHLLWDKEFNSTAKRGRAERPPLVGAESGPGISLEGTPLRDGMTCSDFGYGKAFGLIYHPDDVKPASLQEQYRSDLRKFGLQGIKRANQPIVDYARPGILSECALEYMPVSFRLAGLESQLATHRVPHGTGLNRWHLVGSYAMESRAHSLPAAGSHSGGAANFFVGLNCLSEEAILGKKEIAAQLGLLFSAFTNFGGYHTFVETFPIAQAVASNTKFRISVTEKQGRYGRHLYADFIQAAIEHTEAGKSVRKLKRAYQKCLTLAERIASRRRSPFVVTHLRGDEEINAGSISLRPASDKDASSFSGASKLPLMTGIRHRLVARTGAID